MTSYVYLRGLSDFEGQTLAVFLAGLDCGDFPVVNGNIRVPLGTSADGLLTERWLTQVTAMGRDWGLNTVVLDGNWNVPCVVGYRYKSRGQLVRPVTPADTGARDGPGFGKKKRNAQYAIQVVSTAGLKIGTRFEAGRMYDLNASNPGEVKLSPTELATGILVDTLADDSSYEGMLCWEATGPYSVQIAAIGGFISTEDH